MRRRSVTIVEAGEILGMTRSAAYRAAKAGDIHTISIGSRFLVPVAWIEELLGESLDLEKTPSHSPAADREDSRATGEAIAHG